MEKSPVDILFGKRNFYEFLESLEKMVPEKGVKTIKEILIKDSFNLEEKRKIQTFVPPNIKITTVSGRELDRIASDKNHQGYVIIRTKQKSFQSQSWEQFKSAVESGEGPILILDRIQDPGNLGNILRTAECFGVKHVLMSDRDTSPITPVVEKSSAGAIHHLNIFRVSNLAQSLEYLKKNEYWIMATDEEGSEEIWETLPEPENLAIILGNEGEGVKKILLENSDYIARIGLHGSVSSLNVVVACGITLDRVVNG
ncbi:23S rRNA (guanosine(2251)-2'-O)-methyltransferase RlmB [Leptospira ilyithenensis]|uniref:23S rRNA (Guanosine(2251)-2'-O)-methyltransferase RlmB n=1 Tax=Leptospira ilyithenensis TaxID=2484901 RepID=A0A4V3JWT7_9LEPT|nr:23S rRNA (guanosine(2251)-2'-O)-methyltransferase RlmB [Leptospira ilyithenensis]TGN08318.1 23S rRNA (guanosine(2251)-2'-O)-methyltransferase RlmB [Leptospira ilyithenensis]